VPAEIVERPTEALRAEVLRDPDRLADPLERFVEHRLMPVPARARREAEPAVEARHLPLHHLWVPEILTALFLKFWPVRLRRW
jgi:hypothetical protein